MCRIGRVVIVAFGLLASACGGGSFTVTCADRGLTEVTDSSQRVQLRGFSVLPPAGPHWCVSPFGAADTGVGFAKNQFGGRRLQAVPSEEEQAHTFAAGAYAAEVDGPRPADAEALRAFIERWLQYEGMTRPQPSGRMIISDKPDEGPEALRFTTVRAEVVVDTSLGAVCVWHSSTTEERDNPRARGGVFVIEAPESYVCLHPTSPQELIVIEYSERYIKGRRTGPSFVETLKQEIEPFLRGIRFDAAG